MLDIEDMATSKALVFTVYSSIEEINTAMTVHPCAHAHTHTYMCAHMHRLTYGLVSPDSFEDKIRE